MQAYGNDRVRQDGERWILSSRLDKGWTARVAKTLTSAEFPGTAVLCDDDYFEVVSIEPHGAGGVRYVLERWRDQNAMRVTDRYDAESEAARVEEYRKSVLRETQRKSANALALLTGHLPAIVQNQIGNEIGVLPTRITIMSIIGVYAAVVAVVVYLVSSYFADNSFSAIVVIVAAILCIENSVRWHIAFTQNRPIGSILGFIIYAIYHAITRRGPSPFEYEKGFKVPITEAPPDIARHDAFVTREPLVTLLTPDEQRRVAERYPYDYRKHSTNVALIVLTGAIVGIISSLHNHNFVPTLVAGALAMEQIMRLVAFRRGPAASVLRFVARPFVRRLLGSGL